MGLLPARRRRFRRQEVLPTNDDESEQDPEQGDGNDEENDDGDDDDESEPLVTTSIPSSIRLVSTSTENQLDKAKAIGDEVIKKVPSTYQWSSSML